MATENLEIRGAHEHNLRHVDLTIPKGKLVVFCGVSGSGKSSLAFDTLFNEGQRRYVESLSTYARQFLGQAEKPKYESIRGLSPTIAIEQKAASSNPRSTVGTVTEILDYLRVLYARLGKQHCYQCGQAVGKADIDQIVSAIMRLGEGCRLMVLAPVVRHRKGEYKDLISQLKRDGYVRARVDGELYDLNDVPVLDKKKKHSIDVVVDRIVLDDEVKPRLSDSCELAMQLAEGLLVIDLVDGEQEPLLFSEHNYCMRCDIAYPALSPQFFSFNSPLGMCSSCNGLGTNYEPDPHKIVPDPSCSMKDGAIDPWRNRFAMGNSWTEDIVRGVAETYGIDMSLPFEELTAKQQKVILFGSRKRVTVAWDHKNSSGEWQARYEGIANTIKRRWKETGSEDMRRFYESYMTLKDCNTCEGTRLRPEPSAVYFHGATLPEMVSWSVEKAHQHFEDLSLEGSDEVIGAEVVKEVTNRLQFLRNVGLSYLTLDRTAHTLSGGEAQRIRLASQLGNELTGVIYILDEPSIGLHPRDNSRLIDTLKRLRDLGNTVVVVEHDRETIEAADHLVDFGPGAGRTGGSVVFSGPPSDVLSSKESLTGAYLSGRRIIEKPDQRRAGKGELLLKGICENNLKEIDVQIPTECLVVFTGVSGAGKSTVVNQVLYPAVSNVLHKTHRKEGKHKGVEGLEQFDKIIAIDQKPIGRTPRSNPATYTKLLDPIRAVFAQTVEARSLGYKPGRFSFNVKGGRCEHCSGDGMLKVEMHFLADVWVRCDRCNGRRFNEQTLRVKFKGKSISDVLEMSVNEAIEVFENIPRVLRILKTLQDVGLGYIALGQPSTTLSGGEAQRIKLARELAKRATGRTLYILDEPTTGLHFEDVSKLLAVIHRLVDSGNTVVVIEHHTDVIQSADWIVDLGPEGGDMGGTVVVSGTPEDVARCSASYTGRFLSEQV